ncbi:hypothetical protein ACNKHK_27555 [Shigella flexneri]
MGVNHADVLAVVFCFDRALHHSLPFTAGEVTGLRADNFDVGALAMASAKPSINRHAGPDGPLQLNDVTRLAVHLLISQLANQFAFQHVVAVTVVMSRDGSPTSMEQSAKDGNVGIFRFF